MTHWVLELCGESNFSNKCSSFLLWMIPSCIYLALFSAFYIGKHHKLPCSLSRTKFSLRKIIIVAVLNSLSIIKLLIETRSFRSSVAIVYYLFAFLEFLSWNLLLLYICVTPSTSKTEHAHISLCLLLCLTSNIHSLVLLCLRDDFLLIGLVSFKVLLIFLCLLIFLFDRIQETSYSRVQSMHSVTETNRFPLPEPSINDVHTRGEKFGLWSKLFFTWVEDVMKKGQYDAIQSVEDLCDLPPNIKGSCISEKLHSLTNTGSSSQNVNLLKKLHYCFGFEYYSLGVLKLLSDILSFGGPLLLNLLVTFLEDNVESMNGYYYALMLFCVTLVGSLCTVHYNYLVNKVSLKIRAAIIISVYEKTLALSQNVLSTFSSGEIMNFMSSDTDRIVNFCQSFHEFWSLPIQVIITLYLLYQQIGLSFAVGLGFAVILVPINQYIAKMIGRYSKLMMQEKDKRIKLMSEIFSGIKVIKMHSWESVFIHKIDSIRLEELKYLKKRKYLDAFCVFFWATSPVIVTFLSFTTYALLGNKLTASRIFTSVALFNMLIIPLNAFPWVLNGLIEAHVSLKRIQNFIKLSETKPEDFYTEPEDENVHLKMSEASFTCDSEETSSSSNTDDEMHLIVDDNRHVHFKLGPLNFSITRGSLVCVMGKVGCGKSMLLSAILGNRKKNAGDVHLSKSDWSNGIGLVCQLPWIQKTSIRNNILFGKEMNSWKYFEVLEACALNDDLKMFPFGDATEVGEKGIMLSGGQKARIALARAIYQNCDLYLLDDPIAAVDVHVGDHLLKHCIFGLLQHKTRVVCTNKIQLLEQADVVILIDGGKIIKHGPSKIISELYLAHSDDKNMNENEDQSLNKENIRKACEHFEESPSAFVEEEKKDSGVVKLQVCKYYWISIGTCLCTLLLLSCFFMQASRTLSDWWLTFWIAGTYNTSVYMRSSMKEFQWNFTFEKKYNTDFYLVGYSIMTISNSFFTVIRSFLFAYCGIKAALVLHNKLGRHMIKAKDEFFSKTPLGRIINRFSSDVYYVDDSLPFMLNILLAKTYALIGCIVVTIYTLPWLINLFILLSMIYFSLQNYYRCASRELKRISSVTLSPIYAHFSETLDGHGVIRALSNVPRFHSENIVKLDENQRAMFSTVAVAQWLNLRLQLIGVIIISSIAFISLVQNEFTDIEPGLVGLALSYALLITGLLNGFVTAFTETEKEMISVERIMQYVNHVPLESDEGIKQLSFRWPSCGAISFQEVSLWYKEQDVYALNDVSFEIKGGERVGIVGRTGAGKSSLFQALFRMVDIDEGQITIDGVDVSKLHLQTLRSQLALVPQDPFLFSGTIRENMDPETTHSDDEIWNALYNCHMDIRVTDLGGLEMEVIEKGNNFSAGEKQLLSLARILLNPKKVICLDEATANIDQRTDSSVQLSLRMAFHHTTVLIIAHRIETVMDCDHIIVMDKGKIKEIGEPSVLLQNRSSEFYKLVYNFP